MIPKIVDPQVDFSGGQMDDGALRRDDLKLARTCLKEALNTRPRPLGAAETRMGRTLVSIGERRADDFVVSGGTRYYIGFEATKAIIRLYSTGAIVKSFTSQAWTADQVFGLRWDMTDDRIIICMPDGTRPRVIDARAASPGSWTIAAWAWAVKTNNEYAQPYFRFADRNVTITPEAYAGPIYVTASAPIFTSAYIGRRIRYYEREIAITGYTSTTQVTGTVIEQLPYTYAQTATSGDFTNFSVGDEIAFKLSPTRGVVTSIPSSTVIHFVPKEGSWTLVASSTTFEEIIGPNGRTPVGGASIATPPDPILIWDEEVMNDVRGWPKSVTTLQKRVAFCQMPALRDGHAWSAISAWDDFDVTGKPDGAILERVDGDLQVLDIVGGPDIFLLTNAKAIYIPVSADNPFVSGSAEHRDIAEIGASATVRGVSTGDAVLFVDSGGTGIWAVVQTGQTARPYISRELSMYHRKLITGPVALAYQTGEAGNAEQFAYCVMSNGTTILGHFDPKEEVVGWYPWTGSVKWVSSRTTGTLLTTLSGSNYMTEVVTENAYLDAEVNPVTPGAALDASKPGGHGPLWMFENLTVRLRKGARDWGDRAVNGTGNLVTIESDDISGSDWRVGLFFETRILPHNWHVNGGPSKQQRMRLRKITRTSWLIERNCGFQIEDRSNIQQIPAHQTRDDQTVEPPTRREQRRFRHKFRDFDPEITLRQTTVGRLSLVEYCPEGTV